MLCLCGWVSGEAEGCRELRKHDLSPSSETGFGRGPVVSEKHIGGGAAAEAGNLQIEPEIPVAFCIGSGDAHYERIGAQSGKIG